MKKSLKGVKVGDTIEVEVKKITQGSDKRTYITVAHPDADNLPTLRLKKHEKCRI